jgi:hypothetical protein
LGRWRRADPPRGLEGKIADKLAHLKKLDDEAGND